MSGTAPPANADRSKSEDDASRKAKGGGSDSTYDGKVNKEAKTTAEKEAEKAAADDKEKTDAGPTGKLKAQLTRDAEAQKSGCTDLNIFTLIKIAAIIALIILGAGMLLSGRNREKG